MAIAIAVALVSPLGLAETFTPANTEELLQAVADVNAKDEPDVIELGSNDFVGDTEL